MSNVPIVSKKRAGSKKSQSQSAGSPFPVDILPGLFHCDIAPFPFIPDRFELQPRHDTPDFIRTQGVTQARTDLLQDIGRRDEDARLALERFAEMGTDQVFFEVGDFEAAVMRVQHPYLLLREPVAETAFPQSIGLAVDQLVRDGMLMRIPDLRHLERQPAAVAGRVGQELDIIARAAKRSDMRMALLVAPVGRPLVDVGHGDHRLQLVQLGRPHAVELLETDQGEFGKRKEIVLIQAVAVRLRIEIAAQLGWQQEVEPGGFVKPLFADKDQDLMVHDRIVEQRGQYADKPFPEIVPKLRLVAFDMHRIGQVADRVAHAVP